MTNSFLNINPSIGAGGGGGGPVAASDVTFVPDGDILATDVQAAIVEVRDDTDTKLTLKQDLSEKGQPNGYAELDGSGRVPSGQLTVSALEYKGTWDSATNSPTLTSGVGTTGDTYCVSVAGSTNLDGITDWQLGDFAIFNGTTWEKIDSTDAVSSVNGQVGVVVLDTDDVSEGVTNFYYTEGRFDTSFGGKDTDDLSEGVTNLYYTEARVSANTDVAANTAHRDGGPNKHDSSEIDVEGTYAKLMPSAPTDLETALSEINSRAQREFVVVVEPTGVEATDVANIEAAVASAHAAGGGVVQLVEGTYEVGSTGIGFPGFNGVVLQGVGDSTIIRSTTANAAIEIEAVTTVSNTDINNYSAGATSIFTTTAGDASSFSPGDVLHLSGTEGVLGQRDLEYNKVVSVNGGTGEIVLQYPVKFSMSSAQIEVGGPMHGCAAIQNLRIRSAGTGVYGLLVQTMDYLFVDNVTVDGEAELGDLTTSGIDFRSSSNGYVRNCRLQNFDSGNGVGCTRVVNMRIESSDFRDLNKSNDANRSPIQITTDSVGILVRNNRIESCRGIAGIEIDQGPSADIARVNVADNEITNMITGSGISCEASDCIFENNTIQTTASTAISINTVERRCIIRGNKVVDSGNDGIGLIAGSIEYQVMDNIVNTTTNEGISSNGSQLVAKGNVITNTGSSAFNINTSGTTGMTVISNNIMTDCSTGTNAVILSSGDQIIFTGNTIDDTPAAGAVRGIQIQGGSNFVTISDNIIKDMNAAAIQVDAACTDIDITGNTVIDGAGSIFVTDNNSEIRVINNTVSNPNNDGISMVGSTTGLTNCVVKGNIVKNTSFDGITLRGMTDSIIEGNRSFGNTLRGLRIQDGTSVTTDHLIIKNNNVRGNTGTNFEDLSTGVNNITVDNKS